MIITDRIRRDILTYLEEGHSKSKVLSFMIKDYNIYHGRVDNRFIRDKEELRAVIAAIDGKRVR